MALSRDCIARPISDSARSSPNIAPTRPGDDLRHVDWNVFARTERAYLKRYRGETNTQLTVLLDASASMSFGSRGVRSSITRSFWRRPLSTLRTCSATSRD